MLLHKKSVPYNYFSLLMKLFPFDSIGVVFSSLISKPGGSHVSDES